MLKRLGLGFIKGLITGIAVGAAFLFGLKWTFTGGLLGYLIAMGTGATAGFFAGKPPWKQEAWIEGILKSLGGVAVGAGLYWVISTYAAFKLPFAIATVPEETTWTEVSLLYAPIIAAVYGSLIELDNTDDKKEKGKSDKGKTGARVLDDAVIEDAVIVSEDIKEKEI